ncbi:MAG: SDR family NAD(P)-dependent oxidoreductase [Bacteroidales bacterium]|nr:SDR family NAD(P)-dependent oxidoreductase [Bacteroidales bacterium]
MNDFYSGRVVWITGASSGIGEALVYKFVSNGSRVVASSCDSDQLDRVADRCSGMKGSITAVPFDLADTAAIEKLAGEVAAKEGRIDILLNIGGVSQRALIIDTPLWLDRRIMEVNYFGTIALTKAVLPHMISAGGGHIVATSSISGRFGFPLRSAYSASKQALHGFFETLLLEHKKDNIRVSVLIPGRVRTKISFSALTASGKEHGKMDEGLDKGITPERAAEQIIRGLKRNRREILVGSSELLMLSIRKYFPALFFRLAGKIKPT